MDFSQDDIDGFMARYPEFLICVMWQVLNDDPVGKIVGTSADLKRSATFADVDWEMATNAADAVTAACLIFKNNTDIELQDMMRDLVHVHNNRSHSNISLWCSPDSYAVASFLYAVLKLRHNQNDHMFFFATAAAIWVWHKIREFGSLPRNALVIEALSNGDINSRAAAILLEHQGQTAC